MCVNTCFVYCEQLAIAHQPATGNHRRVHVLYVYAKDQVPGEIAAAKRRRWQIVEQNEIGGSSCSQLANTLENGTEWSNDGLDDVCGMLKLIAPHLVIVH